MPGRAFSRPQAERLGLRVLWLSGLRVGGPGGSLARLGSCANTPCYWFHKYVIDGVIQTNGFHQAHRQRAITFPFRRHVFRPSVKLL